MYVVSPSCCTTWQTLSEKARSDFVSPKGANTSSWGMRGRLRFCFNPSVMGVVCTAEGKGSSSGGACSMFAKGKCDYNTWRAFVGREELKREKKRFETVKKF